MVRILDPRIVHSRHHLVRQAAEMPARNITRKLREAVSGTATTSHFPVCRKWSIQVQPI